jgi:hypothetical protein
MPATSATSFEFPVTVYCVDTDTGFTGKKQESGTSRF